MWSFQSYKCGLVVCLLSIFLANTTNGELATNLIPVQGANQTGTNWTIIPDWPIASHYLLTSLNVSITHPMRDTDYYTNTLVTNVSVYTSRGNPAVTVGCSYTAGGGYNTMTCANGNCSNQITYSYGDVTLTVNCTQGTYTGQDSISYTIVGFQQSVLGEETPFILILGGILIYLLAYDDDKPPTPRRKEATR
jgi:hypothetical protein